MRFGILGGNEFRLRELAPGGEIHGAKALDYEDAPKQKIIGFK